MDINEIRRLNINYWAEKLGRGTLATKIGYKDTVYINQLCRGLGSFGSNTARKIERSLDLEKGWFDQMHAEIRHPGEDGEAELARLMDVVGDFSKEEFDLLVEQARLVKRARRD